MYPEWPSKSRATSPSPRAQKEHLKAALRVCGIRAPPKSKCGALAEGVRLFINSWVSGAARWVLLPMFNHLVNQPVLLGLHGAHDPVAIDIFLYLLYGAARVVSKDFVDALAQAQDLFRRDLDVAGLTRNPPGVRLMDQNPRIGKGEAPSLSPGGQ